ncbi:MAG: glycerol kinase [Gammaproteobacteria bacterium]|nr:MAG: glycerol kinase [Gammaproteobacteria bacterium]TND06807.1 MAG: glycerol kinase [Gammaproteobacteria bacterium]
MSAATPTAASDLYLALDQGGHSSRALVFDGNAGIVAQGRADVATLTPRAGWVENDPDEVVNSLTESIRQAAQALGPRCRELVAAGLATQRSSIVCWHRQTGAALSPVISWQDRRTHAQLKQYQRSGADIHKKTGLFLTAHYGATKLRWCLDHLPAVRQAHGHGELCWGPLAAFLVFRLLRERPHLVDPANASRTLLWSLRDNDWEPSLLDLFGLPQGVLPTVVSTRHGYGTLPVGDAAIPLTILTGDQSAAIFSLGYPQPDAVYINVGTGAFVQRIEGQVPAYNARLLTSMVLRDDDRSVYALEGTVNGAASALDWLESAAGVSNIIKNLPEWLAVTSSPPLFLNGVGGLGAPFWIPNFENRFIGEGEAWQKAVAVIESIVFLLMVNLEEMQTMRSPPETIHIGGGLTALDGLCQRLADLAGLSIYRAAERESTARGTAFLLAGCPARWPEHVHGDWFTPRPDAGLRERYHRWSEEMQRSVA